MYNYSVKLTIHGMFPPAGRKKRQTAFGTVWFSKRKCRKPDWLPAWNDYLYSA